jgi:outer membrane protein TolC
MNIIALISIGAAFVNPQAVEQTMDNSPALVRAALEESLTQEQVDALESKLLPPPTAEQKESDLKQAKALLVRVSDDPKTDKAVKEVESKLKAIEDAKPKIELDANGNFVTDKDIVTETGKPVKAEK